VLSIQSKYLRGSCGGGERTDNDGTMPGRLPLRWYGKRHAYSKVLAQRDRRDKFFPTKRSVLLGNGKPASPASLIVGTSGRTTLRLVPLVPSTLSLPDRI